MLQAEATAVSLLSIQVCCQGRASCNLNARFTIQVAEAPGRHSATEKARVAVLGASGYTGEEVVRLLALHPVFDVTALTGETQAGKVRWLLSCQAQYVTLFRVLFYTRGGPTRARVC